MNELCALCYAEDLMDVRYKRVKWGPKGTRSKTSESNWQQPLKWNKKAAKDGTRPRVFCSSLSDVFEDWNGPILDHKGRVLGYTKDSYRIMEPDDGSPGWAYFHDRVTMRDLRQRMFQIIDATPNLDWLLLTKRPENILKMWEDTPRPPQKYVDLMYEGSHESQIEAARYVDYRPNVWLGCSAGTQKTADEMIPELLKCRDMCPVLWVSGEPLLEWVDYAPYLGPDKIQWLVLGGESSQGKREARPCGVYWIRDGVEQCRYANVTPFVKQLGSRPFERDDMAVAQTIPLKDKAGADPDEWPEDLRVQEFPLSI